MVLHLICWTRSSFELRRSRARAPKSPYRRWEFHPVSNSRRNDGARTRVFMQVATKRVAVQQTGTEEGFEMRRFIMNRWWTLALALAIAFVVAYPVNRWLIARGKGHAVVHAHHAHH